MRKNRNIFLDFAIRMGILGALYFLLPVALTKGSELGFGILWKILPSGPFAGMSLEKKNAWLQMLPGMFLVGTVLLLIWSYWIVKRRGLFRHVCDFKRGKLDTNFVKWAREGGHSLEFVKENRYIRDYEKLEGLYEWYMVESRKKLAENREKEAFMRASLPLPPQPVFLRLSVREIALRTSLAALLLSYVVPLIIGEFVRIDDAMAAPLTVFQLGMLLIAILLWITWSKSSNEIRTKISSFRFYVKDPKFIAWCRRRGYVITADTGREDFSKWAEEYQALGKKDEEAFEAWLKLRWYDLYSGEYDETELEEIVQEFETEKAWKANIRT